MKCIIVDDEPLARRGIAELVAEIKALELVGSFNHAEGARDFLLANDVDLIFLDIQMPGMTGLEFARSLAKNTLVIFTTAYSQYALDSYEVDAIDYLVKPISQVRFSKAIEKALTFHSLLKKEKDELESILENHVLIRADRRFYKIAFDLITHIEGLKDYVVIYTRDSKYVSWINLKNIHQKLPDTLFLRISKSYIVNHHAITSFDNNSIFIGDTELSIGKAYQESFFKKYIGRGQP